ncbi:MAG: DUF4367 domain-containing protein, partial [Chitinophagales bacterium]
VRDALLSLPFWPDNLKQQLLGIDDWQHTLVLPDTGDGSAVTVRGQQGMIMSSPSGNTDLVWLEDGVVYNLEGQMSQTQIMELAESLR